jgi:hypothetical protein
VILVLWAAPRSRSTAFFRMMAERGDHVVLHEPFSNRAEFGHAEVAGHRAGSEAELLGAIRALGATGPVFVKDTTDERYPGVLADEAFLARDARHTFLVRHPAETIRSYHAVNPAVRRDQIGLETLHELFTRVRELTGEVPVVLDGDDLVEHPDELVAAYCDRVGLPHRPDALRWRPQDRPEWGPTARWHVTASRSAGFVRTPRTGPAVQDDPVLAGHLHHHLPFYEQLRQHRLRV